MLNCVKLENFKRTFSNILLLAGVLRHFDFKKSRYFSIDLF